MSLFVKPVFQDVADLGPRGVDEAALHQFGCDVSFISDESASPRKIVQSAIDECDSDPMRRVLWDAYDRIRAEYDLGEMLSHPAQVAMRIRQSAAAMGIELDAEQSRGVFNVVDRANKVIFQHQTLSWLAESDAKIHLYGRGWETNEAFAKFARGEANDAETRQRIAVASRINLAVGAYGAVSARMLDGVAQGGFFLMRFSPADVIEKFYPPLLEFCASAGINTNGELAEQAPPGIRAVLEFATRTLGIDLIVDWPDFVPHLLASRMSRARSAAVLWPQYPKVAFSSREELQNGVVKYLYDMPLRRELADEMRQALIGKLNRVSVSVSRRSQSNTSPKAA